MSVSSSGFVQPRVPAIIGGAGGLLATIGFFLPWYATTSPFQGAGSSQFPTYITISGWDLVNQYLTGTRIGAQSGTIAGPTLLPLALTTAIPLIMALVALTVGVVGLTTKPTALIGGLTGAAGIAGMLYISSNSLLLTITEQQLFNGGNLPSTYPGSAGLGLALIYLGFFGAIAGGLAGLVRPAQTTQPS